MVQLNGKTAIGFEERLKEVNAQFEKVSLRVKKGRFYIRGTFPPKPGEEKPRQAELKTGCNASPAGLKVARLKAQEIDNLLLWERFDWAVYLKTTPEAEAEAPPPGEAIGTWLERYELAHWEHTQRTRTKEQSFLDCYQRYFMRLPVDEPLTLELLRRTITEKTNPASRGRELACMSFYRLAEFVAQHGAIDLESLRRFQAELRVLKKGYKPERILPEDLPSEAQIVEIRKSIRNPAWRWLYGMIATYGLRPHEIFHLDLERFNLSTETLRVFDETKTGSRMTFPCLPEWREQFELWNAQLPNIRLDGKSNTELGKKISQEFRELKIFHNPYALRHAWCIRLALNGVNDSIAAKWAGHSLAIHEKTYLQAISEAQNQHVFEQMKRRIDQRTDHTDNRD